MRKFMAMALTAILSVSVLTGCSSSNNNSGSNAGAPSENNNGATAQTEALTIDKIKEKGTLVIGGEMNYPPFEFYDDDENVTGYDIEIWQKIADGLGVELEVVDIPFSGALTGLDAGQYDVVGCAVGVTAERAKSYLFSSPMFATFFTVNKMADNDEIQSTDDLAGKTVGVQTGSSPEMFTNSLSEKLQEQYGEGITVKSYSGPHDSFLDMQNGGLDAVIESYELSLEMGKENSDFVIVDKLDDMLYASFVFKQTDTELCDYVSAEIQKMKDDGSLYEMQERWFGYTIEDLPADNFVPAE